MNIYLIVYILVATLSLGVSIGRHGKERSPENGWVSFIAYVISMGLVLAIAYN